MLSFSVAEISVGKVSEIMSLYWEWERVVQNKTGPTKASSSADVSATEKLKIAT